MVQNVKADTKFLKKYYYGYLIQKRWQGQAARWKQGDDL